MKKLLFISFVLITLTSCGGSGKEKKSDKKQEATTEVTDLKSTVKEESYIKVLSYNKFIRDVWDFEKCADSFAFRGNKPCVIDFYATWCGPCKMIAPIMEKLAKEYAGKVDFYKVDTDKEPKLAMVLQIQYLPTVLFAKDGEQPEKSIGGKDEEYFRSQINKMLGE